MKNVRISLTFVAILFAFVASFASLPTLDVTVDLKPTSGGGACDPDESITSLPPGCSLQNTQTICTIVRDNTTYEIHNAAISATCSQAYRMPN